MEDVICSKEILEKEEKGKNRLGKHEMEMETGKKRHQDPLRRLKERGTTKTKGTQENTRTDRRVE